MAYSTYLGGSGYDYGNGIAVDAWGNAYVIGHAQASDFPLAHPLSTNSILRGLGNAFVSKLSFDKRTSTLSMAYSTYLGGGAYDIGSGIAVDTWGNAYVTGRTQSSDFPLEHPLPTNSLLRGVENAFVSKLAFDTRTATLSLAYSTYLGGSFYDDGYGIAVDARGNAYVTGSATSSDFPLAHALPSNSALQGGGDARSRTRCLPASPAGVKAPSWRKSERNRSGTTIAMLTMVTMLETGKRRGLRTATTGDW